MLTRMAADWFPGRDLPTAMGVLSSSWPLGIALALVALPPLGAELGWRAAFAGNAALGLLAAAMLAVAWRAPARAAAPPERAGGLTSHETGLTLLAGLVWGLYNAALVSVLSFGADLLVARGRDPVAAAAEVSGVSWACLATIAMGGWIASRSGRPGLVAAVSLAATAAALVALTALEATSAATRPLLILAGLAFGPAAGPILALTARIARERVRTLATGVFFALYYAVFAGGPALVGVLREATGVPETPILAAVAMLLLALPLYGLFQRVAPAAQPR
jgi:predicted MFS family arabinose efflux permease